MSKTNVHKTVSEMQKSAKTLLGEIKKTRHKTRDNIALFKGLQSEIKERDALARRLAKEEAEDAAKAAVEVVVEVALEDVTEVTTKADEPVTEVKEISPVKVEAKVEEKQEVVPPIVEAKKDEKPKKVEAKAKKTTKVEEKKVVKKKVVEKKIAEKKPEPPIKVAEPTVEKKPVQEKVAEKVKRPLQPPMTRMEELRQRNIKASKEAKANHERLKLERANAPKVEPKPVRPKTQGSGLGQPRRPQGNRPQGGRPPIDARHLQGKRPQGQGVGAPIDARHLQGRRPQGTRPPIDARNQQGNRTQGSRPPIDARRPQGARPPQQGGRPGQRPSSTDKPDKPITTARPKNTGFGKRPTKQTNSYNNSDNRNRKNKKQISREQAPGFQYGDAYVPRGSRRRGRNQRPAKVLIEKVIIEQAIITTDVVLVKDLAEKIGKPVSDIVKQLILIGTMATANQYINFDTAQLIASELGVTIEQQLAKTNEEVMLGTHEKIDEDGAIKRPPVVTIMGHVDHGKTSLLDAIKHTNVANGEAGGITQHIGAYSIELNGERITFLDTPGHEAFTSMRARGAQATDIVVIVVAADDGVMPQTIEAINHVKASGVPMIIAINKMDLPGANPERVKQELTEHEVVTEEWGGDVIMIPVSAITGLGLDDLLENIILISEMEELRANPDALAQCVVIEAKMDHSRGAVTTVLVQNGTLRVGDTVIAGFASGRIRAMVDDKGNKLLEAGPSMPVEVSGFSDVPNAGDIMHVVTDEKLARRVAEERNTLHKAEQLRVVTHVTLDDLFNKIEQGNIKKLNIVIKADVQGSVEAVRQALEKLSNDDVQIVTIHSGVGAVNETDIMLAAASNAIVIGFNVRPDAMGRAAAAREKIDVRLYRIIYKAIEDMQQAMTGMLDPIFKEEIVGHVQVRNTFKVSSIGTIAGCYVTDGTMNRNCGVRIYRDDIMIFEGKIASLKRFKDDVREVASGFECGMSIVGYNDIKEDDVFEAFRTVEVKR